MKRSAAITGPTPQFVRWAIDHGCPLREIEPDNLPESTFAQLRCITALSDGRSEGRIFEQICVHDSVDTMEATNLDSARGFLIEEVYDVLGGPKQLDTWCLSCPANASALGQPNWGGCFGWLPADSSWSLKSVSQQLSSQSNCSQEDLPALMEGVIKSQIQDPFTKAFGNHINPWYGLWRNRVLSAKQLDVLQLALESLVEQGMLVDPVRHLLDATRRCQRFDRDLHVELVPPGFSDGTTWTVFAHCPDCKCVAGNPENACQGCGRVGNSNEERRFKVLGLRPYLLLKHLLGTEETGRFLTRYRLKRMDELPTTNKAAKRIDR